MNFLNRKNQITKQTNKNKISKGEKHMKNTKLKVLVVTLAVCLLAMGSLSTLAWFTAEDEVTNNFLIADSEDDADEIFSINVWEKDDEGNVYDDEGITYPDIQPGDDLYKEVNIENTGYYDQYVRATVTITGAVAWYDVFDEEFFALKNFATDLNANFVVDRIEFNLDTNEIIYTLYYNNILKSGEVVNLFTNINITTALDQYQAAALSGEFDINVKAEAVQTANVKDNAKDSFAYVNMGKDSGEFLVVTTATGAKRGMKAGILDGIPVDVSFDFTDGEDDTLDLTELDVPYVENFGTLEVIGGTAKVGSADHYGFITKGADAETVINGTEITSNGGGIGVTSGASVIFNDGSVNVTTTITNPRYVFYVDGEGSEVVINDGKFDFAVKTLKRAYVYAGAGTTVTINGGTFGTASTRTAAILGSGTVVIKGGTFGFNPSAWVDAANYDVNYDATAKTWTVVAK